MARPAIVGTVTRRIDLNHASACKNKDYRITIAYQDNAGTFRVYTEHGPAGRLQNGRELTSAPVSLASAWALADRARDTKMRQRDAYRVVQDWQTIPLLPLDTPTASVAARPRRAASAWNLCASSRAHLTTLF